MAVDFNPDIPSWTVGANLNITQTDSPLKNPLQGIQDTFNNIKTQSDLLNAKREAVYGRATQIYLQGQQAVNDTKNSAMNWVTGIKDQLNDIDAKFIILKPFSGDMNTLRSKCIEALSNKFDNHPNFTANAKISSVCLVFSMDSISQMLLQLTQLVFNFFGIDKALDKIGWIHDLENNPLASMFGDLVSSQNVFQDAVVNETVAAGNDFIDDLTMTAALPQTAWNDMVNRYNNNPIKSLIDDFKDPAKFDADFQEAEDFIQGALGQEVNVASGKLEFMNEYTVTAGVIQYGSVQYTVNDSFVCYPQIGVDYTVLSGPSFVKKSADAKNLFDTLWNNWVDSTGKQINKTNTSSKYNNWYTVFNLNDLLGNGINGMAAKADSLIGAVSGGISQTFNDIFTGLSYADYIAERVNTGFSNALDHANNIVQQVPESLTDIHLDIFTTPAKEGGMNELRFAYSEWFKDGLAGPVRIIQKSQTTVQSSTVLGDINANFADIHIDPNDINVTDENLKKSDWIDLTDQFLSYPPNPNDPILPTGQKHFIVAKSNDNQTITVSPPIPNFEDNPTSIKFEIKRKGNPSPHYINGSVFFTVIVVSSDVGNILQKIAGYFTKP